MLLPFVIGTYHEIIVENHRITLEMARLAGSLHVIRAGLRRTYSTNDNKS